MENIITYKIKYDCQKDFKSILMNYIKRYNNLLKCTYNFMFKNNISNTKEIWNFQSSLNNISKECGFKQSSIIQAEQLIKQNKEFTDRLNKKRNSRKLFERQKVRKVCFGGKSLYQRYNKELITKEQFKLERLMPIYCVGESSQKGNRHFRINNNNIIFQPNKKTKIQLKLESSKHYKRDLEKLQVLQESKEISITYSLDLDYIYITFDLNKVRDLQNYKSITNRYMSIDLNPNYIGYVISDWKGELDYKIINSGVISIKDLNDYENSLKGKHLSSESKEIKYVTNKRKYEVYKISQKLVKLANHYRCEVFGLEDLSMESSDKERGKRYNRLCNNQWCRDKLVQNLEKHCKLNNIKILKVNPAYSSFIGNTGYRVEKLPDMCLSALEIGRRTYEFNNQYIKKCKEIKKNIIFPDVKLFQKRIEQALEEIDYIVKFDSWKDLYYLIKKSRQKYRLLLSDLSWGVSSIFSQKSYLNLYQIR